ncbi:MAG TPA: MBL fold metallo-hydrolase [Acidimicrobiales bacterium]|nr:MBL fold metallo-hydrolase [Acidimicrobiales bacterium]
MSSDSEGRGPGPDPRRGGGEITADELVGRLGTDRAPMVVDVREPAEFVEWSIAGARNIPMSELGERIAELDHDREVVVVCAKGARSRAVVDALGAAGVAASGLLGGMEAWASVYDTALVDLELAEIVQVRRRGKGCLSYVVGAGEEAFVVDPSLDTGRYLDVAARRGWHVTRVFDTHLHADHVSGARALAAEAGASLHLNPADSFEFPFEPMVDGQWFELGPNVHFGVTIFGTPGHTKGSTVLEVGGRAILTGDTLFVDGVGRPDLAERVEEFAHDLYRSLHAKLLALPEDVLVLPAHYGDKVDVPPGAPVAASLATLRRSLEQLDWDEPTFVAWAASRATPRPPNYAEIISVNMGRHSLSAEESLRLELGPNRCAA